MNNDDLIKKYEELMMTDEQLLKLMNKIDRIKLDRQLKIEFLKMRGFVEDDTFLHSYNKNYVKNATIEVELHVALDADFFALCLNKQGHSVILSIKQEHFQSIVDKDIADIITFCRDNHVVKDRISSMMIQPNGNWRHVELNLNNYIEQMLIEINPAKAILNRIKQL